jgi:hypothetical protein
MALRHPTYGGSEQHDSHAFADRVQEQVELERGAPRQERAVVMQTCTTCRKCGSTSERTDISYGVDVDVAGSIEAALGEQVSVVPGYECRADGCRERDAADQVMTISGAGQVLEVRVKRVVLGEDGTGQKNGMHMAFPPTGLKVGTRTYQLRAVAVHHGDDIAEGHYTTYAKRDRGWYHANDRDIEQVSEARVLEQIAHTLWYCPSDGCESADGTSAESSSAEIRRRREHAEAVAQARQAAKDTRAGDRAAVVAGVIERIKQGDCNWRDILGVAPDAEATPSMRAKARGMLLLAHSDNNAGDGGSYQLSEENVNRATLALLQARRSMAAEVAADRWARTAGVRQSRRCMKIRALATGAPPPRPKSGRHYAPIEHHQCPPRHVRRLPVGTWVHVRGSAENRARVRAEPTEAEMEDIEWESWRGVIVGAPGMGGDYEVETADDRGLSDGVNPYSRPYGTVRVPWQVMTVIGAPAAAPNGPATALWKPYERQWLEERGARGGNNSWRTDIEAANAAERARNWRTEEGKDREKRKAERLLLTEHGEGTAPEEAAKRQRRSAEAVRKRRANAAEEETPSAETRVAVDEFLGRMAVAYLWPPAPSSGPENTGNGDETAGEGGGGGRTGDEGARLTRAWTHDAGDEELGDADAQAERAAKRQRHAETRRAQRMLRHNSEAWLAEAQAERAAVWNDFGGRKASSSAAASSAPEQAAAPQPLKTKKRVRWREQHEADTACSSAAASSAPERAAAMQPPKPTKASSSAVTSSVPEQVAVSQLAKPQQRRRSNKQKKRTGAQRKAIKAARRERDEAGSRPGSPRQC